MNAICSICGEVAIKPSTEHLIPLSRGGKNGPNKTKACMSCNNFKSDMTLSEYHFFLEHKKFHPDYIQHLEKSLSERISNHVKT